MNRLRLICSSIVIGAIASVGACKGASEEQPAAEAAKVVATETDEAAKAAAAKAEEEQAKKQKEAEERAARVAKTMEKHADAAKKELERWTDDMRKQAAELAGTDFADGKAGLTAILASPHRVPGNGDRDTARHPLETLTFFGIQPDMTVIEVGGGSGWYTELLAPLLAKKGKLIVSSYDPEGAKDEFITAYGIRTKLFLEKSPELFGKVEVAVVTPPEKLELAPEGTADMAIAIREMHNWNRREYLDTYVASVFKALKPGGIFGVVQHRAAEGADAKESSQKGYVPEKWLVERVEAAGFKLEESSDINNNPKDTKDYEKGVWTLPPVYTEGDKDRDKYQAIGESDRMTLRFVKPKA